MKTMKKYATLASVLLCLGVSFTSCSKDEPKDEPKPVVPVKPNKELGDIALKDNVLLMSINEAIPLYKLFKQDDIDFSKLGLEMSKEDIVEVSKKKLKAVGTGELTVTFTYGEKTQTLSLLVADCTKPLHLDTETCKKYIWDYEKSPKKIINKTKRPLIIDFWADWCGPCKFIAPLFDPLAEKYNGKVLVLKVDLSKPANDGGVNWEIYDNLYFAGSPNLDGMFELRPDGKTQVKLPAVVLISKGDRAPKLTGREEEITVPIYEYMEKEFALD